MMTSKMAVRRNDMLKIDKVDARHPTDERKSVIYCWPKGETVLDQLFTRHERPHDAYRKLLVDTTEFKAMKAKWPDLKLSWSQKAGCSCGCSPGFVIKNGPSNTDWHVDIVEETADAAQE